MLNTGIPLLQAFAVMFNYTKRRTSVLPKEREKKYVSTFSFILYLASGKTELFRGQDFFVHCLTS